MLWSMTLLPNLTEHRLQNKFQETPELEFTQYRIQKWCNETIVRIIFPHMMLHMMCAALYDPEFLQ